MPCTIVYTNLVEKEKEKVYNRLEHYSLVGGGMDEQIGEYQGKRGLHRGNIYDRWRQFCNHLQHLRNEVARCFAPVYHATIAKGTVHRPSVRRHLEYHKSLIHHLE